MEEMALSGRKAWWSVHRDRVVDVTFLLVAFTFTLANSRDVVFGLHGYPLALRVVDLATGVPCLAAIFVRKRWPVAFAVMAIGVGTYSTLASGVALVALLTVAVHRPWKPAVAVSVLSALSAIPTAFLYEDRSDRVTVIVGAAVISFAVTGWGMFVRARRELVASLREQLAQAEAASLATASAARRGERERIAREMHDVLAHRLSLLAVHAGALQYAASADRGEVGEAATVVQSNARAALQELRSVIDVLRDRDAGSERHPQPTLADIATLVDESRRAGGAVSFRGLAGPFAALDPVVQRTAYRVVQEALTNARKHASGAPVDVALTGGPGRGLQVMVRNDLLPGAGQETGLPGTGTGLIGLRERTDLAGGRLEHGPADGGTAFVLRADLPWPVPSSTSSPAAAVG